MGSGVLHITKLILQPDQESKRKLASIHSLDKESELATVQYLTD